MDSRAVLELIAQRNRDWRDERLADSELDLFDGDMRYVGALYNHIDEEFEWVENDTGSASVSLPRDHYLVRWVTNHQGREKRDIHIRFRKQGAQWDGRLETYKLRRDRDGEITLELIFKHCFEELKHILVWCNPFTPAALQFPRIFAIFGKLDWCMAVTLWLNVARLEAGLFMIPGDPFDPDQWPEFDMTEWSICVVPVDFASSAAPLGYLWSRFGTYFDTVEKALKRSQLSIDCRRWYEGDPVPEGLGFTPRHGALIVRFVDNSGWLTQTSFFGSVLTGLERAVVEIAYDGATENISVVSGDPTFPDEYYEPGWFGSRPQAPAIVLEDDGESGIIESEFEYFPASDFQHVAGGQSFPGIDEGISAAVVTTGNFAGSFVQLPGYGVGLSGLGAAIDAVAKPLYSGTVGAWMNVPAFERETDFGRFGYKERRAGGDIRAGTLGAFAAVYSSIITTRERTGHRVKFSDSLCWRIGPPGFGDMWIGTRVAVRPSGVPDEYALYCEQIRRINYQRDRDGKVSWESDIGWKEPDDPFLALYGAVRDFGAMVGAAGL